MESDKPKQEELQEEGLHEHFSFTADKGQEPLRVDKYLMNRIENATRNKINKLPKRSIFVNDQTVKSNYKQAAMLCGHCLPPPMSTCLFLKIPH